MIPRCAASHEGDPWKRRRIGEGRGRRRIGEGPRRGRDLERLAAPTAMPPIVQSPLVESHVPTLEVSET
jgi:hypothetical protein